MYLQFIAIAIILNYAAACYVTQRIAPNDSCIYVMLVNKEKRLLARFGQNVELSVVSDGKITTYWYNRNYDVLIPAATKTTITAYNYKEINELYVQKFLLEDISLSREEIISIVLGCVVFVLAVIPLIITIVKRRMHRYKLSADIEYDNMDNKEHSKKVSMTNQ